GRGGRARRIAVRTPRRLAAATTAALFASGALAQAVSDGTARVRFTAKKARSSSGLRYDASFGTGADGKSRVLTGRKLRLPPGTKLDPGAVAACSASEQDIVAGGGAAKVCPPASQLGT